MAQQIGNIMGQAIKSLLIAAMKIIALCIAWALRIIGTILHKISEFIIKQVHK